MWQGGAHDRLGALTFFWSAFSHQPNKVWLIFCLFFFLPSFSTIQLLALFFSNSLVIQLSKHGERLASSPSLFALYSRHTHNDLLFAVCAPWIIVIIIFFFFPFAGQYIGGPRPSFTYDLWQDFDPTTRVAQEVWSYSQGYRPVRVIFSNFYSPIGGRFWVLVQKFPCWQATLASLYRV